MEVIAARTFNGLYILVDVLFLAFLALVLLKNRRFLALGFGLAGAVIYFLVDYGIFYRLLGTRVVEGGSPFLVLLWLSVSYGFTNFAWIWLWLDRDKRAFEWSVLIMGGWLASGLISQSFGAGFAVIRISRGTTAYHGVMALLLFVGYAILCAGNIREKDPAKRANLPWILAIGVLVQFGWEFMLLITGIRPAGFAPLVVNSLLETNMGLPYIYFIHRFVSRRYAEDLTPLRPPEEALAAGETA